MESRAMSLDQRSLDASAAHLAGLLADAERYASSLVTRSVNMARDHAVKAVTDTLRKTAEGRATIRKASLSPSFLAAKTRLDELKTTLAGGSKASLVGTLRDARAVFYQEALREWAGILPEDVALSDVIRPTMAGLKAARTLVLHGMELRDEIGGPIDDAKRRLLAAVGAAGNRIHSTDHGYDLIETWARQSTASIFRAVRMALGDSLVALDGIACVDATKPELRREGKFTP